ncbi:MAG: glycosyltransferase family 2 protein, partial [Phycisphaerales bacterium]|nr:glycosyltransferase family 2 protein [Phycisphaerales bacterium]
MPTLHVVIPFYNEQTTLEPCLVRVLETTLPAGWSRRVVLVDDHSEAGPAEAARRLCRDLADRGAPLQLLRHEVNRGKGAAVRTGFDAVLADSDRDTSDEDASTGAVIIQDADLEYDPDDYACLLQPLIDGTADAVFGTRWGAHRRVAGWRRLLHMLGNRFLTRISNALTGLDLQDMECCYKVMPVPVLRRVRPSLTEDRFGVEPQLAAVLARQRWRVAEVPVRYDPRRFADGKK